MLRCWERVATSTRNEAVAQLFDQLILKARAYLGLKEVSEEEDSDSDGERKETALTELESEEPKMDVRASKNRALNQHNRAGQSPAGGRSNKENTHPNRREVQLKLKLRPD